MKAKEKYFIIFDVFGVLLTRGLSSSSSVLLSKTLNRELSVIRPIYERWEIPFDLGALSEKRFWELVQQDLGTNIEWQILNLSVLESYSATDGSLELLEQCNKEAETYLLSNTRKEWFEYLDNKFTLKSRVKQSFLSYELGLIKPNLDCYSYVIDKLGCNPHQILFIDDNKENVQSATSVGWIAHQFIDPITAKSFLSNYIDLG